MYLHTTSNNTIFQNCIEHAWSHEAGTGHLIYLSGVINDDLNNSVNSTEEI